MSEKDLRGLYGKYVVQKTEGEVDPRAVYFTLRVDTDKFAWVAIRAYVDACQEERPELARDLEELLRRFEKARK